MASAKAGVALPFIKGYFCLVRTATPLIRSGLTIPCSDDIGDNFVELHPHKGSAKNAKAGGDMT